MRLIIEIDLGEVERYPHDDIERAREALVAFDVVNVSLQEED